MDKSYLSSLLNKKVRVTHIECGSCPSDKRWEGYIGKVVDIRPCPDGNQIWLEGMSVSLLDKCDKFEEVTL